MTMAEHLTRSGTVDNLPKAPCPQIIHTRTTKDRVDNVDTHFRGLTQEKITISKKMSMAMNAPKKTDTLHSAS